MGRYQRFSLVELILVMALLTAAMAMVVPNLGGFFRGRRLDHDARRLWALTRQARELAIAQAVPVEVWVDPAQRRYGLQAVAGYGATLKSFAYDLTDGTEVEALAADGAAGSAEPQRAIWWPDGSLATDGVRELTLRSRQGSGGVWRLRCDGRSQVFVLTQEETP